MPNLLRVPRLFLLSSLDALMGRIVNLVVITPNLASCVAGLSRAGQNEGMKKTVSLRSSGNIQFYVAGNLHR